MNEERSFERFVADNVAGNAQSTPLPDDFYDDIHSFATTTRQRPEWLALIKEPPMRTDSRVTVGSPTVRVMAILAATFLLIAAMAAVGIGVQRLLAADGELVVDQSGNGHYTTITEAVAAAADGDDILVMPGTYAETFVVDKAVAIRGEGQAEVIVQAAPQDYVVPEDFEEPELTDEDEFLDEQDIYYTVASGPFGIEIQSDGVNLEALTLQDNGVRVRSGSAAIDSVTATEFELHNGTNATLTDVEVEWILSMLPGSNTNVADSQLCLLEVSGEGVIERSTIGQDCVDLPDKPDNEVTLLGGVLIWQGSTATLRDNDISVPIDVRMGAAPTIEHNRVVDTGGTAIRLFETGDSVIRGNTLTDNRVAILLPATEGPSANVTIESNTITGGRTGIALTGGSSQLTGNTIENVEGRAVAIGSEASAVLRDNTLCGNREDLYVDDGASADVDDSNEICE